MASRTTITPADEKEEGEEEEGRRRRRKRWGRVPSGEKGGMKDGSQKYVRVVGCGKKQYNKQKGCVRSSVRPSVHWSVGHKTVF